jgi:hypothetical protein
LVSRYFSPVRTSGCMRIVRAWCDSAIAEPARNRCIFLAAPQQTNAHAPVWRSAAELFGRPA